MTLADIPAEVRDDAVQLLYALADDELIMANRLSRWVGSGPTLEEDNTLSSFVQDELGHARLWLEVIAESDERSITALAQNRPPEERRHTLLVEPDHESFADTIVRNFLYDFAEYRLVQAIRDGDVNELAARAEVILKEEHFHREHAEQWLRVMSATDESQEKLRTALDANLPRARDYFAFEDKLDERLTDAGVIDGDFAALEDAWIDEVASTVEASPFDYDADRVRETLWEAPANNGRAGEHTETLTEILDNIYPTREELYPDHTDFDADIRYEEKIGLE